MRKNAENMAFSKILRIWLKYYLSVTATSAEVQWQNLL